MTEPISRLHQLLLAGRYAEAEDVAAARERGSWSGRGLHLAALLYERLLRPADAINVWLEFNERYPSDPRGAIGLARNMRRVGDAGPALQLLRLWHDRLRRDRRNRVLFEAGLELIQLQQPNEAAAYLAVPATHDVLATPAVKALAHCAVLKRQNKAAATLLDAYDRKYMAPEPPGCTIVSYPKAGVTWLSFMISSAVATQFEVVRDRATIFFGPLIQEAGLPIQIARTHDDTATKAENGDERDHMALFLCASRERYRDKRVLLLIRDPRSIVVSLYHQLTQRTLGRSFPLSLSEFIHDPVLGFGRVVQFHAIWARCMPTLRDHLVVAYEDILANPGGELRRVLDHLGLHAIEQPTVEAAVESGRSENLRELERCGQVDGMIVLSAEPSGAKVRQASISSWRKELRDDETAFLEASLVEACEKDAALRTLWQRYLK